MAIPFQSGIIGSFNFILPSSMKSTSSLMNKASQNGEANLENVMTRRNKL